MNGQQPNYIYVNNFNHIEMKGTLLLLLWKQLINQMISLKLIEYKQLKQKQSPVKKISF